MTEDYREANAVKHAMALAYLKTVDPAVVCNGKFTETLSRQVQDALAGLNGANGANAPKIVVDRLLFTPEMKTAYEDYAAKAEGLTPEQVKEETEYHTRWLTEANRRAKFWNEAVRLTENNPFTLSDAAFERQYVELRSTVAELESQALNGGVDKGEVSEGVAERYEAYLYRKDHPEELKALKSGFSEFDKVNGGFMPGELNYVLGRQGDGKSVFLLHCAHAAWLQGENVILFSLEISKDDYTRRFDAKAAQVNVGGLKLGQLTDEEELKFKYYCDNLAHGVSPSNRPVGKFYVVDVPSGCTPSRVRAEVAKAEQEQGIEFKLVIVDYAGLMYPDVVTEVQRDNIGNIALGLKQYARETKKVVFSAVQMNREAKAGAKAADSVVDTSAVYGSDQVAFHCDGLFAIRSLDDHTSVIDIPKMRDGKPIRIKCEKRFEYMSLVEQADDGWSNL